MEQTTVYLLIPASVTDADAKWCAAAGLEHGLLFLIGMEGDPDLGDHPWMPLDEVKAKWPI